MFSKFRENPSKIPVKVFIFSKVKKKFSEFFFNTFTGIFQGFLKNFENTYFDSQWILLLPLKH